MKYDPSEVQKLGNLVVDGKVIATLTGLCVVENLSTLQEEALVAVEYKSGEVRLMIVQVQSG